MFLFEPSMWFYANRYNYSSSLRRIESSTMALETTITEIKNYIQASSKNSKNQYSVPPSVSVVDNVTFRASLSAALMKNAEVLQPWGTIGADQWIQAGRWWLLKVCPTSWLIEVDFTAHVSNSPKWNSTHHLFPINVCPYQPMPIWSRHLGYWSTLSPAIHNYHSSLLVRTWKCSFYQQLVTLREVHTQHFWKVWPEFEGA